MGEQVQLSMKVGPLINIRFAAFLGGRFLSGVGDVTFDTSVVLWVATVLTHGAQRSPLAVSGVLLASSVPAVVLAPVAGVFVDRWNKRRVMLCMDALRALLIPLVALAAVMRLSDTMTLSVMYGIVLLSSAASQFFNPASVAALQSLVDAEDLPRASGLLQTAASTAGILGAALGSVLFFAVGINWAILLDALSFVASFGTLLVVGDLGGAVATEIAEGMTGFWREFRSGAMFVVRSRAMTAIIIAAALVALGGGALAALDVFFVTQNLGAPASFYGFLGAIWGIGAILGSLTATLSVSRVGVTTMFYGSLLGTGVLVIVYARQTTLVGGAVVLLLIGLSMSGVQVAVTPLVLRLVPVALIGRVISIMTPVAMVALSISTAAAGLVDTAMSPRFHVSVLGIPFGPVDTIFSAAGLLITAGGIFAMRSLRSERYVVPQNAAADTV